MARKFHRKDRLSALTEINVTPLIDLAFALLIIFMITTPLLEQTVELNLPVEAAKKQAEDRENFQSISIDRAGAYYWGEGSVSEQQLAVRFVLHLRLVMTLHLLTCEALQTTRCF